MKNKIVNILLFLILIAGLSLLLYPTVSDYYNSYLQSQVIVEYSEQVNEMDEEVYRQQLQAADAYNKALLDRTNQFALTGELEQQYWNLLCTTSQNIMAYVEIPSISVTLPIAHGTEKSTLNDYVGHLVWSSLPVGGESTHSVISGHSGLPSSELFTNVDHLELGDKFFIHVLGQTLEYRVDHIAVVEPHDYSLLGITEGRDFCTLVTCTPYGINSHRLLVRGTRIDTPTDPDDGGITVWNEIHQIDLMLVIPVALAALVVVVFLILLLSGNKKKKGGKYYGKT